MATLSSSQVAAAAPVYKPSGKGMLGFAYGVYELAANPTAADIIQMCRVPAGAKVVDGFVRADDIDTGVETLDIDIGWAANGVEAADPDGFGNLGVWTGDATTDVKPETMNSYRFNGVLKDGPASFTNETIIQLTVNAAAAAGGTGTIFLGVYYIVD